MDFKIHSMFIIAMDYAQKTPLAPLNYNRANPSGHSTAEIQVSASDFCCRFSEKSLEDLPKMNNRAYVSFWCTACHPPPAKHSLYCIVMSLSLTLGGVV